MTTTAPVSTAAPAKVKPKGLWYLVPVLVLIATGIASIAAAVSGFVAFDDTIEGFARIPVGGEGVVTFEDTGGFTAYYEEPSRASGSVGDVNVTVVITPVDGGDAIVTAPYFGTSTYTVDGVTGQALDTFSIEEAGDYRVQAQGSAPGDLAVGRSPFKKIGAGFLSALLIGLVGTVVAIVLFVLLAVKRGRSRRAIRAQQPPGPGGAPYGTPAYGAYGAPQYGTGPPTSWTPPPGSSWPGTTPDAPPAAPWGPAPPGPPAAPPPNPPGYPPSAPPSAPPSGVSPDGPGWAAPPQSPWSPPGDPDRPG